MDFVTIKKYTLTKDIENILKNHKGTKITEKEVLSKIELKLEEAQPREHTIYSEYITKRVRYYNQIYNIQIVVNFKDDILEDIELLN